MTNRLMYYSLGELVGFRKPDPHDDDKGDLFLTLIDADGESFSVAADAVSLTKFANYIHWYIEKRNA